MIWTPAYLNQLTADAQEDITTRVKCLFNRVAIDIQIGVATYALPLNVTDIVQVTWLGRVLQPLTQFVVSRVDARYLTNQGTPQYYSADAEGPGILRFYPVPNATISINGNGTFDTGAFDVGGFDAGNTTDSNGLFGQSASNFCVVSYFYSSDRTVSTIVVPQWIYRPLVKAYVLGKAFGQEGKGQNLQMSVYYLNKYETLLKHFKIINSGVTLMSHRRPKTDRTGLGFQLARPVLPANYGTDRYV